MASEGEQTEKEERAFGGVLLATGFRPFFLLAALHAVLILPIWIAVLRGHELPLAVGALQWHGHEMVYGFATAVIAGFLLTAVRHWTGGLPTASGVGLAGLCLLWLAGRASMFGGELLSPVAPMLVNLAFLPALGLAVGRPILRARSQRNHKVLAILALLWGGQLWFFLEATGASAGPIPALALLRGATLAVVLLCVVITGRIVPLFTANATGRRGQLRSWPAADGAAVTGLLLVLGLTLLEVDGPALWAISAATGLAVIARMRWWGTLGTLRDPLLWILHLGHLWIAVGLLLPLLGLSGHPLAQASAMHALAYGGIGTLILGMMVRVTLGHTGRALETPRTMVLAFALFTLGALCRILLPLFSPSRYQDLLSLAALLWAMAFLLYLLRQGFMLVRPRPDGRPG